MDIWLQSAFGIRWEYLAAHPGRLNTRKDPRYILDSMCGPENRCGDIAEEKNSLRR
jgi:hypothetical protein